MAINLDAKSLLQQYGQSKQLQIERLLSQYGTSLKDMRELYPQLTETISQRRLATTFPTQELFFTPSEAAQMGLSLSEGYMLKMTPNEAQRGYGISFITPEKWEIKENDIYITPSGEQLSRADMEALLGEPTGDFEATPWAVTIEDLTEAGKSAYQEYQQAGGELDVKGWVDLRERQQLETEQVFGVVFPEQDIQEVIDYMNENREAFLADIREIGPTEDVVALLKAIPFDDGQGGTVHLTDEEIQDIFGTEVAPEATRPDVEVRRLLPFPQTPVWATMTTPLDTIGFPGAYGEIPVVEAAPLKDAAYVFAGSIKQLPAQIGASVLQAVQGEGGASVVNKDWADEKIAEANENLNEFVQKTMTEYPNSQFLLDVAQLSQNLGYSIVTMGVGSLAALPLWLIPEPTTGTKVAAMAVTGAVSGFISHRMVTYQITQQYLEFKDAEKRADTGQGLTLEEENQLKIDFHDKAVRYGLWEAIPEGISNMLFSGILGGAFTNALTRVAGQKVAQSIGSSLVAKFGSKAFGIYGEELLTETITQKGQAAIEVEAGLREGNITWWEAFKEIAPQTFLLTTIMTGAGQVIVSGAGRIRARTNSVENIDKITNSLKNEIGEGNPLYEELKEHIEEEVGKGTITEQDAKKVLEAGLAESVLQDIKVAEEIKVTPVTPEVTTGKPYTATVYRGYKVGGAPVDEGLFGKGTYYTTSKEYAETYDGKEVMTVTLKNPFVINTQQEAETFWNETTRPAREQAINEGKTVEEADELAAQAARAWLESKGYDGLIARNIIEKGDEVVVFHPEKALPKAEEGVGEVTIAELKKKVGQASDVLNQMQTSFAYKGKATSQDVINARNALNKAQAQLGEAQRAAIPETATGMPEAGLQPSMLEEVPAKEVRPEARGKLVQSRIDDYLRLREYNTKATEDRISEIKSLLEKKGRLPKDLGLKGNLRLELARLEALLELDAVEIVQDIDSLIREVETELGRRSLPGQGEPARKGIALARHPRKPNIFPEYTSRQLEEMLKVYEQARQTLSPEVPALKPVAKPEPTQAQIEIVKTDPTPASDAIITSKFIEAIKDAKPAREATEALKHEELSKRSAIYASILQGGEGWKAFDEAKSALRGPLPISDYDIDLRKFEVTDADIERMFDRIRTDENLRPFEKLNTAEALTNLIMGQIPTEGELILLEREFGSEFVKAIMDKMPTSQKVTRIALDIANIPRTLKTFADLSATLRQGATLAVGQPVQFATAFKAELQTVFSEKNFKLINEIVHNNVYADKAERYGLYIAPIEEAVRIEAREEAFRGRLIERVPVIGSIVRASERAYITFLNVLRMETWAYYCRQWEGTNKTIKDYTDLASFINHATGRGDLGALSRAGSYLSAVFFSPRYVMSRLQLPLDLIKTTPAVRKIAARNLVSWVGANLLVIMLLELAGADVEKDPRSSDFGKVRFGNTRIDFWAGFQPYVRNIAQIIAEERKSTRTGEIYKIIDPIDIGVNFVRSKLAPVPGLLWSLKSGKTFIGEELSAENAESIIYQELTPLAVQDWIDAVRWSNEGASTIYGLLAMLGVGVQTWSNNWETAQEQLGLPERSEVAPYTIENDVYDMKDYYSEVGQMIGGATYEMLAERGDIPELVLMVAKAKDAKKEISLLPSQRLTSINADPSEGDTFEQYHAQWMARKDITDESELAKFDDLYPKAYLGNMTQSQYALLVEYHSLSPSTQGAFIAKHPELHSKPRDAWLRSHPEENAILALMGQSDVYSLEALSQVSSLAKSLDIPVNALLMEELDEVAKLKLKNQDLSDLLDAYSGLDNEFKGPDGLTARDRAIQELYVEHPDFRDDQRRIEALNVGTKDNPTPEEIVELWVERGIIVDEYGASSAEAKLWLIDNQEAHQWALDNALLSDDGSDWNEPVLRLQVQYEEQFSLYTSYGDSKSPNYISSDAARADAREALLFNNKGKMTEFGTAYYTVSAYNKDVPENYINLYVQYYQMPTAGYDQERFLMEHEDYYNDVWLDALGNQPKDFSKIPTVEEEKLLIYYDGLATGTPRLSARCQDADLDDALVRLRGLTKAYGTDRCN